MKKLSIYTVACLGFLSGCASVVSTNETARVPVPSIASTDSLANIEIKELVRGQGCVTKTLGIISSGDKNFLDTSGNPSFGVIERAKAAATYNALSKDGLSTDILVNPVWEIHNNNSFFVNDVCARVVGYRGVIKGFKQMQTVTRAAEHKLTNEGGPIEKRATNSHFMHDTEEIEHEVFIHEEARPNALHEASSAQGPGHAESEHKESGHAESAHKESAHAESEHKESGHTESAHKEAAHAESAHKESAHAESAHKESAHAESEHKESGHAESAHKESGHKESEPSESSHAESKGSAKPSAKKEAE